MVDIGTHKLNIVCTGSPEARPVVVLEAGGGASSSAWKDVQAALPPAIRACAYDRAGSGRSSAGPPPRSMDAEVADLHALLAAANIPGPIVFVGHSLGGIYARLYVQRYPDSVAGLLLLDPTDEDDLVFNTGVNRWIAVRELEGPLGDGARSVANARHTNPALLKNRPFVVIAAGKRAQSPGTSAEQWLEMRTARDRRVKELTALSANAKFILDPASGHNIEHDNPKLVAATIQALVDDLSAAK